MIKSVHLNLLYTDFSVMNNTVDYYLNGKVLLTHLLTSAILLQYFYDQTISHSNILPYG